MPVYAPDDAMTLEAALAAARPRLVRLCARLTGDPDTADDLAQQTLLIAWQSAGGLRDAGAWDAWLAGIARNLARGWIRQRQRELARRMPPADEAGPVPRPHEQLCDEVDLEEELEREELADLLDRALGLLPATTRTVLVERYLRDRPQAEIAARLGLSETAIGVRVHRAKRALRQVLATRLRDEAAAYDLVHPDSASWQETRLWCPKCGQRHLSGRFATDPDNFCFQLRCPVCHAAPGVYCANADARFMAQLIGVRGYKRALLRLMAWADDFYRGALANPHTACPQCGHTLVVATRMADDCPPSLHDLPGAHARCPACGWITTQGLGCLILTRPETRQFWRTHPRMYNPPRRTVEADGQPAIVTSFVSRDGSARLDVVSLRASHQVIGVHQTPSA